MKNLKGLLYAILSSATFGLIPLLALPIINAGMTSPSVLFYRFLFSAILMGGIAAIRKSSFKISIRQIGTILFLGFLYAATALLLLEAYTRIPSGVATTIHFLYPLVVSLIMIFFFKEKASRGLLFATFISLAGVGILSWNTDGSFSITGLILALSSIFAYAIYIVGIQKSNHKKLDEYVLTFYILTASALFFLGNALIGGGIEAIPDFSCTTNLILLAIFPTVVSDLTLILAIRHIGPTTTSILGSMEPVTAVTIGVLVLNEPFGPRILIGILLILIAVITVILSKQSSSENKKLLENVLSPIGLKGLIRK